MAAGAAASDEGLVLVHNLDECSHSISASDADLTGANQTGAKTGPSATMHVEHVSRGFSCPTTNPVYVW